MLGAVCTGATLLVATSAAAATGALDPTFGPAHNGTVLIPLGQTPVAAATVRQADGKFVVAGSTMDGDVRKFALLRFNPDGTPDPSFGTNGSVLTAIGDGKNALAAALAVEGDGKLLAVGTATDHGQTDITMVRYTPTGALDPTFGTGGVQLTKFPSNANATAGSVVLQPDGKILAGGSGPVSGGQGFAVARFNPNGSLDTTFGSGGVATTAFASGSTSTVTATLLESDGKILAAGSTVQSGQSSSFALARYTPSGALDTTFGTGGKTVSEVGSGKKAVANSAALLPDGRVVLAGMALDAGKTKIAMAGYTATGAPDPSFGSNGIVLSNVGDGGQSAAVGLLREADGKLIAIGTATDKGNHTFAVVRYLGNGSPDSGFGTAGVVTNTIADGALATAGTLIPDGKLFVAGSALQGSTLKLVLARYTLA